MIYELSRSQFSTIGYLLSGERVDEWVQEVVFGRRPGWVFVDNVMMPQTAMIWSESEQSLFFIGDSGCETFNSALISYLKYILIPRMKKKDLSGVALYGADTKWDKELDAILAHVNKRVNMQAVFEYPKNLKASDLENQMDSIFETLEVKKSTLLKRNSVCLELAFDKSIRAPEQSGFKKVYDCPLFKLSL